MMCATGMESAFEELNAVLQSQQNPIHVTVAGQVTTATSSSLITGGGAAFREGQQSFSEKVLIPHPDEKPHLFNLPAMHGSGSTRPYNDSSGGTKPNSMTTQTMNPFQDQSGRNFGPSTPIAPKNGLRRQEIWSGGNRNFMNGGGRNGESEIDARLQVPDYPSALLDQTTIPMTDPYRPSGGGLSRYHSAPSSFLAGLAADFQQDNALSSFFNDADLPQLNATSDSSLENMDTEQSSSAIFDDKFLLDTRKFERIGAPQLGGSGSGGGLVSQKSLQSSFKPSMEVVLENQTVSAQMPSSTQIPASSQMSPGMPSGFMPSSMGLGQQISNSQQIGQQQMNPLVNLTGNMAGNMIIMGNGLGSEFISNGPSGALGGLAGSGRPNNLLRQSSSPAGLLAQLSIDVQGQVPKTEKQSLSSPAAHSPEDSMSGGTSEENLGTTGMLSGLDVGVWEDAANSYMNSWGNDTFSQRKRFRDNMDLGDIMGTSETSARAMDHGPAPGSLTRHMSLPSQKSKAVLPDDILQSVPCRIRAKRGCATHPRSIAERVRRTRISERMRKLQELVPNMDKQQTNTADMLDEAVEYVKQLQRQVQELTESQAKCNGSCHQDHKTTVT